MDISDELKAARAEIDAEVQNFLALLKENINTEVNNAGQYLAAVRERQGTLAMEQAKGQGKILLESLTSATSENLDLIDKAFNRTVKVIHGAEERAEKTIASGLAAIEEAKQEAIAAIRAEQEAGQLDRVKLAVKG